MDAYFDPPADDSEGFSERNEGGDSGDDDGDEDSSVAAAAEFPALEAPKLVIAGPNPKSASMAVTNKSNSVRTHVLCCFCTAPLCYCVLHIAEVPIGGSTLIAITRV